jgi:hypothetical protein
MTLLTIIIIIVSSALSFFAGISTKSREQKWLTMSVVAMMLLLFGVSAFYKFNTELNVDLSATYLYFMAFGAVIPRLIANIVNQNRLESPAIFIKRKTKPLQWILVFSLWAFLTVMILRPNTISISDGMPIYDEDYFRSRIGILFFTIPSTIFLIIGMLQRTAFCSNGLFYNGLLFDWSDFKSYAWKNEWLEMEKRFIKANVQLLIPSEDKQAIEELLTMKVKEVPS